MMLVAKLVPAANTRVSFSLDCGPLVPIASGCYVLTNVDGVALYIGQSVDLSRRMEEHLGDEVKRGITPHGKAFWFYYALCSESELSSLEGAWVNAFKLANHGQLPYLNSVNPPTP